MKPVIDRQAEYILSDTIKSLQKSNMNIALSNVMAMTASTLLDLETRKTMFPGLELTRYSIVPLDTINTNTRYLKADLHIMFDTINDLGNELYKYEKSLTNKFTFNNSNITRLRRKIEMLKMISVGNSYTYIETFANDTNINQEQSSNYSVDTNRGTLTITNATDYKPITTNDVDITVKNNVGSVVVHGSNVGVVANDLIGRKQGKEVTFVCNTQNKSEISMTITISLNPVVQSYELNHLLICPMFDIQTPAEIKIYSVNQTDVPFVVTNRLLNDNPVSIPFDSNNVSHIEIKMYRSGESKLVASGYQYDFTFNGIEITNKKNLKSATVISKQLTKKFPEDGNSILFDKVVVYTNDNVPLGTSVDYSISSDGINWHSIVPMNKMTHSRNVINFSSTQDKETTIQIENGYTWRTQVIEHREFGNIPLYEIATIPDDVSPESIKLYRGYGDYSITRSDNKVNLRVADVIHMFTTSSERFPLCVDDHSETLELQYDDTEDKYYIQPRYYVPFSELAVVKFKVGSYYYDCIISSCVDVVDTTTGFKYTKIYLESNDYIQDITHATVTFSAALRDIEKKDNCVINIDEYSLRVKSSLTGTYLDQNYLSINHLDKTLVVKTTVGKSNINPIKSHVYISYQYSKKRKIEYKTFETNITVFEETEIQIFPFTGEEVLAGNFHNIDGVDVSQSTSHVLSIGNHVIKSTNPHKSSDHELDVNDLTGKHSNAGIDLSNIIQDNMLAFPESLRMVSITKLANVISPSDHKVFACANNKIFINFVPEQLPSNINIYEYMIGSDVCGKHATYNPVSFNYDQYVTIPEMFKLIYNQKSNLTSVSTFYYKIDMSTTEDSTLVPEVSKLSINLI